MTGNARRAVTAIRRSIAAQEGDSGDAGILRLIRLRLPASLLTVLRLAATRLCAMRPLAMRLPVMRLLLAAAVTVTPTLLAAVAIAIAVTVAVVTALGGPAAGRLRALRVRAPIADRQRYADELFDVAQELHLLAVAQRDGDAFGAGAGGAADAVHV
ncbi:MAG: hypothetical protein WBD71_03435, partial [Xanthobacteraceae bacterium]